MDVDTIKNSIIPLGRNDFKKVVYLVLPKIFNLKVVNVDGKNDGGYDWLVFKDEGGSHTIAVQDTVQVKQWEKKAKEDARKAVQRGADRFFFITPKSISRLALTQLQESITSTHKIPCTCLGAKEISELIVNAELVTNFLDAIDAPLARGAAERLDKQEICLHAYVVLAQDSDNLKNTVYEDSVLITLYNEGPLARDVLVEKVIGLLGCEESRDSQIQRRIDSLLTRNKLIPVADRKFCLGPDTEKELENAERIYLQEFNSLVSAQTSLMQSEHNISWSLADSQKAAVLLAKVFIQEQLESARSAKLKMTAMGLLKNVNESLQRLREFILSSGVPKDKLDDTIREMLVQAQDLPIVKKLSRGAVFVALEGVDAVSGAKAIGAPRWSDVNVMLDASVAIPYLCARLFEPTTGRFSTSNHQAIETLHKLSVNVCIPYFYINECAAHLLLARQYDNLDIYAEELQFSQNRFVAHYYQLKKSERHVPNSLAGYLACFSSSCKEARFMDPNSQIRKVMTDLQPLFHQYNVEFEEIPQIPQHYTRDVETEYAYMLKELGRNKDYRLVNHDVSAIGHVGRQTAEKYEHWVILTWDRAMISVGKKTDGYGWIISPDILYQFAKPYRPVSESQLCTLAHAIARTQNVPNNISAQVIDRIVNVAGDQIQEWKLEEKIKAFTQDLLSRIDLTDARYLENDWVNNETDQFIKKLGIERPSSDKVNLDFLQ